LRKEIDVSEKKSEGRPSPAKGASTAVRRRRIAAMRGSFARETRDRCAKSDYDVNPQNCPSTKKKVGEQIHDRNHLHQITVSGEKRSIAAWEKKPVVSRGERKAERTLSFSYIGQTSQGEGTPKERAREDSSSPGEAS